MGSKRKYQGEKGGRFTRKDGSKDHDTELRPAASHPESPETALVENRYPHSGEIALTGKAVKERWPINPDMRKALVDRMAGIVSDGEDPDSISAGRVMVSMDKQNLDESRGGIGGHGGIGALQINVGATQPAEVDFEYLQWRKNKLMGKGPEAMPDPPLADIVRARKIERVASTDFLEVEVESDPLDAFFRPTPDRPRLRLFA